MPCFILTIYLYLIHELKPLFHCWKVVEARFLKCLKLIIGCWLRAVVFRLYSRIWCSSSFNWRELVLWSGTTGEASVSNCFAFAKRFTPAQQSAVLLVNFSFRLRHSFRHRNRKALERDDVRCAQMSKSSIFIYEALRLLNPPLVD